MNTVRNDDENQNGEEIIKANTSSKEDFILPYFHDNDDCNANSNSGNNQSGNDSNETEISATTDASDTNHLKRMNDVMKSNKAISYQDIHSEYTKRRYRNVESKVAQYIANIRAQDKKRRNSRKSLSHGTLLQQQHINNHENEYHESHQTLSSPSSDDNALNSHEISMDGASYDEKHIHEELLKLKEKNDYLEAKVEEKQTENCRLKQNLNIIQIELLQCKDKLKHSNDYRSANNLNSALSKYTTQTFAYMSEKVHKITQTDICLTPSPINRSPPQSPSTAQQYILDNTNTMPTPLTPVCQNPSTESNIRVKAPIKAHKPVTDVKPLALNFSTMEREYDQYHDQSNSSNTTLKYLRQRSKSFGKRKDCLQSNDNLHSQSPYNINNMETNFINVEPSSTPTCQRYKTATTTTIATSPMQSDSSNRNRSNYIANRIKKLFTLCTKCRDINNKCDNNNNSNKILLNNVSSYNNDNNNNDSNTNNISNQQESYRQVPLL